MYCTNHMAVSEGVWPCARCARPFCNDCVVTLQGRRLCAQCKTEQMTDLRSGVDTTQLQLAGIGRRFAAIFIDGFVLGFPMAILVIAIMIPMAMSNQTGSSEPPNWLTWLTWLMIPVYIAYEALMLAARGQTLGKMAMRIRVVQPTGLPISTGQAWGRAVVRALFVSFLSLINYLPAFFTREKTCIHDMAARTRVVLAD